MSFGEFVLYGAAAFVAIATLLRMMRQRRDELIDEQSRAAGNARRANHRAPDPIVDRTTQQPPRHEQAAPQPPRSDHAA